MLARKQRKKQQDSDNGRKKRLSLTTKTKADLKAASQSTSKETNSVADENDKYTDQSCDYLPPSPGSDISSDLGKKNMREDDQDDIGTGFRPGQRLEVMDFNEKWYPVRVLEVDYEGEGEVLVHYEKWSNRYDEWVRMDSNRIRRPTKVPSFTSSRTNFKVGEKVMATWSYSLKFPALVKVVHPNDKYDVLFYDGYQKTLRGCKVSKATEEDLKNMSVPRKEKRAPPIGSDPVPKDLGTKEERRQMKRKYSNVLEILHTGKKRKTEKKRAPPPPPPPPPKPKIKRKQRVKKVIEKIKKERKQSDEIKEDTKEYEKVKIVEANKDIDKNEATDMGNKETPQQLPPPERPPQIPPQEENIKNDEDSKSDDQNLVIDEDTPKKKKRKRNKEHVHDVKAYVYTPRRKPGSEDDSDRWDAEIPEGAVPVKFDSPDGILRESIIVPDKKLPAGWTKHTMLRRNSSKWDVFLVNPDGRKFRSRNELRTYFKDLGKPYPEDHFDFMVGRKRELVASFQSSLSNSSATTSTSNTKMAKTPAPSEVNTEVKRIKTLLPKTKGETDQKTVNSLVVNETTELASSAIPPPLPSIQVASVQSPINEGYTCPKEGCGKYFRKENLLQMHIKHYHPEYSKIMGSTPNVADLAYARTVGEPLEDSRGEVTASGTFLDRLNKFEAERKARAESNQTKIVPSIKKQTPKVSSQFLSAVKSEKNEMDAAVDCVKNNEIDADKEKMFVSETSTATASTIQVIKQESKSDPQQCVTQKEEPSIESNTLSDLNHSSVPHLIAALTKPLQINNKEEKQNTIKTILPLRPPVSENIDKLRLVEEANEDEPGSQVNSIKTIRVRKRDTEHSAKKNKLGLEDSNQEEEKQEVSKATSYRFALNKTTLPQVTLEKISYNVDCNGRVQLSPQDLEGLNNKTVKEESSLDAVPASEQKEEVYEQLKKEEIINCICGFREEDGLMIQCDLCLCWQHGLCNNISKESEVPEKYVCYICQNPTRQRNSNKYSHNQEWIVEGKLPSVPFRQRNEEEIAQRELTLKKSHDLTANLLQLQAVIHSLRVKTHIAQKPSHPKLYLWAKSWAKEEKSQKDKGDQNNEESKNEKETDIQETVRIPEPEAAIDEEECRLRLLQHIEDYQQQVEDRLTSLQAQVAALESEDPDLASDETPDFYPQTKQTVQMIQRDLQTMNKVALLS